MVPPLARVSGLLVNPLVKDLDAGRSTLVSIRYDSKFRDVDYKLMMDIMQPEILAGKGTGLISVRNKKLEERLKKEKAEKEAAALAAADPKTKNDPKAKGAAPAKAPKEAEKPAANQKQVKKTQQQIDEEEAEERRAKEEAEAAERKRQEEIEAAFDKERFLKQLGGVVFEFDRENEFSRTQHFEWLVPVYFRPSDNTEPEAKSLFLQVRTTTVKRTLIPTPEVMDFGEVPVAFKKTKEILIKNVGNMDETLNLQSLTPFGGFSVLNAMRTIKPGETKPIVI